MSLSLGIIFGIVAMFGYGLSTATSQRPSKEIGAERTAFFRGVFVVPLLFLTLFFTDGFGVLSLKYIAIMLGIALVGYIPLLSLYKALSLGSVGVVAPVANSSVIFTVLFSVLLFGESLPMMKIIAIVLIVAGIVLMTINFSDFRNSHFFDVSSGIPYALITCLFWGLTYALLKIPVSVVGPIFSAFFLELGVFFFSGIYLKHTRKLFFVPKKNVLKKIFLVALTGAIGTLAYNVGINNGDVSVVSAVAFANPLVSAAYARVAFKEKMTMQQLLAALIIVTGIVMMSYL